MDGKPITKTCKVVYGYKDKINLSHTFLERFLYELKYTGSFNLMNVIYFGLNLWYLVSILHNYPYKTLVELIVVFVALVFLGGKFFKIYIVYPNAVVSFYIREITTTRVKADDSTFNGMEDIVLKLENGATIAINLYQETLEIVEDNDLLILGKNKHEVYDKAEVKSIYLDNKNGNVIEVVYNGNVWSIME